MISKIYCSSSGRRVTENLSEAALHLSVVSHGQDDLVAQLLASVARHCDCRRIKGTVVRNIPGNGRQCFDGFPFPVAVLENSRAMGFGANHNQVFASCQAEFFCVLNPDIILTSDPFPSLLSAFCDQKVGAVAPLIVDPSGRVQDSARRFPTPGRILRRSLRRLAGLELGMRDEVALSHPDWVAGMFMLLNSVVFREVGGFDEEFFMYCEDADLCMRLHRAGYCTILLPNVRVVHDARRASHRSFRHLSWHMRSLMRFFFRYPACRL